MLDLHTSEGVELEEKTATLELFQEADHNGDDRGVVV